jgi:hypothetical protein
VLIHQRSQIKYRTPTNGFKKFTDRDVGIFAFMLCRYATYNPGAIIFGTPTKEKRNPDN